MEATFTTRQVWPAGLMVKASVSGGLPLLAEDSEFDSRVGRFFFLVTRFNLTAWNRALGILPQFAHRKGATWITDRGEKISAFTERKINNARPLSQTQSIKFVCMNTLVSNISDIYSSN